VTTTYNCIYNLTVHISQKQQQQAFGAWTVDACAGATASTLPFHSFGQCQWRAGTFLDRPPFPDPREREGCLTASSVLVVGISTLYGVGWFVALDDQASTEGTACSASPPCPCHSVSCAAAWSIAHGLCLLAPPVHLENSASQQRARLKKNPLACLAS
jgi:hypothetical protein